MSAFVDEDLVSGPCVLVTNNPLGIRNAFIVLGKLLSHFYWVLNVEGNQVNIANAVCSSSENIESMIRMFSVSTAQNFGSTRSCTIEQPVWEKATCMSLPTALLVSIKFPPGTNVYSELSPSI